MKVGQVLVPVSVGELFDKITILELKLRHGGAMNTPPMKNVVREFEALNEIADSLNVRMLVHDQFHQLRDVNGHLWRAEDRIREFESKSDFGPIFIQYARAIYGLNDRRAALKRTINQICGSEIMEEKFYN